VIREYLHFLRHCKRWWLLPLILWFVGLLVLGLYSSKRLDPFIYPLF
jgi:hypothetical protein